MPSPLCEVSSASLGAWTSTVDGVDVVAGEVVSVRLADTAGVIYWAFALASTDELTGAHGTSPALTINLALKTASFTVPVDPANGVALKFRSVVGVMNLGLDQNGAFVPAYTTTFGVFVRAPSGIRVLPADGTLESSSRYGWTVELNSVIRAPPGSGAAPTGAAGGDLGGAYPNPSVLRIRGASVPASGALTTGNVLQVTGVSALGYAPVNLAGGVNFVTGALPIANFAPGTNGFVLTTAAGVPVWAQILDTNVAVGAAIAPSKLGQAAATSGQVLAWSGTVWAPATPVTSPAGLSQGGATTGQALIWNGTVWGPSTNFGAQNLVTTGTLSTGAATHTALTLTGFANGVLHVVGANVSSSLVTNSDVTLGTLNLDKLAQSGAIGTNTQAIVWSGTAWIPFTITAAGAGAVPTTYTLTGSGVVAIDGVHTPVDLTGTNRTITVSPGTLGQILATTAGPLATWATAAGDWSGAVTANVVTRINGATVPAAGALTIGHVLQVSGTSALTYGFVVNANIDVAAAIAVSKLASSTNGFALTIVAGVPTWAALGSSTLPASAMQFQNVATIAAMQALVDTTFLDGTWCWVRSVKRSYVLDTNGQTPSADLDTYAAATAGRMWMGQ